MKVSDLIRKEIDVDVYDDVDESLGIAFCGPLYLREEGVEQFGEVLDYEVDMIDFGGDGQVAVVKCDDPKEKVWRRRLHMAKEFFYAAAGYCTDSEWDAWFFDDKEGVKQ